jgi:hypothetical protein
MKKNLLLAFSTLILCFELQAQDVSIPNANFKAYLVGNSAINTNLDTEIQVSEATAFTGTIDCSNLFITNMSGIEAFINITVLDCSDNSFLSSVDISSNTALLDFRCENNMFTSLDLSANTALTQVRCMGNDITSLDLSTNTALTYLDAQFNQLASIDVSANLAMTSLYLGGNNLTTLDISANPAIYRLHCFDNDLTEVNAANGNNSNFTVFVAHTNPTLICIEVDDAAYSTTNWTNKDAASSFSVDCNYDLNVEESTDQINSINLYPNPAQSNLNIATTETIVLISILNLSGQVVQTETKNTFSVQNLPAGIYVLQVQTEREISTARFIKE